MAEDERCASLHPHGFGFYPQASGHRMARQQHDDSLVIYCVEGRGLCELEDRRHTIRPGDLLALPAGTPHRYWASPQQPWSIFWMHLGGRAAHTWLEQMALNGPVVTVGLHERLVQDFRTLLETTASDYRFDNLLLASSLCQQWLASANRHAGSDAPDTVKELEALHAFMDTHLDQRLTLAQLLAAAGADSRYQFIRDYKKLTGQTPMQAFLRRKMAHACYLLEVGEHSVAEIGRQLGFDDPYYFSRAFKRIVGLSPTRYREQGGGR